MGLYDIAIIGMGCIFPEANSVDEYWKNIASGDSYIKKMPTDLWHLDSFFSEDRSVAEKSYTTVGSFISGFEFPFLEYKLPPNALKGVDPAQLVTLEATKQALLDAGIEARSEQLVNACTVVGASGVDGFAHCTTFLKRHYYFDRLRPLLEKRGVSAAKADKLFNEFAKELENRGHEWNSSIAAVGAIPSSISNRVAQVFGIKGANMTVDAACASSFVALDVACQALMAGDVRMAVAGGTDLGTNPAIYVGFCRVDGLSQSGHSNPFDHTADGLIIGEGVGMVVLKRLEDALSDGDRIRGVIRGIGSSSDGAGQAIYAPSVEGRAQAFRHALEKAQTDPQEVQFLEAHATSTIVGDANEYDAISKVYAPGRDPKDPLYLGSVKAQIGHLKAAAGVAGLIKTVVCMEHGQIPHLPRFTKLTPGAQYPSDALTIPTELTPWKPRTSGQRIGAITTSGFGGVNYHAIVEHGPNYAPPKARAMPSRKVAIVGTTIRVAGASTVDKWWDNVTAGKDVFTPIDAKKLGWEDHIDKGPENERITTRAVSVVPDYELKLLKHKIFPNAVSQVAPTQFLALDLADRLLEEAGLELKARKKIAVSIGAMHDDYFPTIFIPMAVDEYAAALRNTRTAAKLDAAMLDDCLAQTSDIVKRDYPPTTEHTLPGWMTNVTAGRLANKLNLGGPNFTVDTACSSGVASLLPAMYQLMYGDVDMVISGGLNRQLSAEFTCGVCALGAVAKDTARPFDEQGKGFLIGEGGVLFLLKRLEDAKRDGDNILAVIHNVNGSSEADSKTMVAPTEDAIRRAIANTLTKVEIPPEDIGVVDTHGSANLLSDVAEARSLAAELRPGKGKKPVQITAIKSHIGHLYGGSGATSLLSSIQALRTKTVPGIRKLENIRPELKDVLDQAEPRKGTIPLPDYVKAGGVNSLGLGGANYFVVVTAEPAEQTVVVDDVPASDAGPSNGLPEVRAEDRESGHIFVCVAPNEQGLALALTRALQRSPIPPFVSEGSTAALRLAATFNDEGDLRNKLTGVLRMLAAGHDPRVLESQGTFIAKIPPGSSLGARPEKLAFCFPGQGTHYIGMGRNLYATNTIFRKTVDRVQEACLSTFNFDLLAHIHGDPEDKEIKKALGTLVGAQTSLFAVELGVARMLGSMGVKPDVMVGHSFGEISALTVAGVWDIETALKVVEARIKSAELVIKGKGPRLGMASVICSEQQRDAILDLAGGSVVLTNINAPNRFVVAGEFEAIERSVKVAESFGANARILPIGAAFHSHFMEPAREPFRRALVKLPCSPPRIPILSTITGEYLDPAQVNSEFLARHLSSQFVTKLNMVREINRLRRDGLRNFLEVGPGWSMSNMIKKTLEGATFRAVPVLHPKVGDEETFRRSLAFLMAYGHLPSAAARRNLPGMFTADFLEYVGAYEPAILSLLYEVHLRFLSRVKGGKSEDLSRSRRTLPAMVPPMQPAELVPPPMPAAQPVLSPAAPSPAPVAAPPTGADVTAWIARLKEKLVETTGYPEEMLEEQLDLEADLGVDSVQRAEIWVALCNEHGLDAETRPEGPRTIANLAANLANMAGGSTVAVPAAETSMPAPAVSAAAPTSDDVGIWVARLKEKLVETTGYPEEMLEEQLDLEADLGVDSVQRAEIWVALCNEHALDAEVRPEGPRTIANLAANLANMAGVSTVAVPAAEATMPAPAVSAAAPTSDDVGIWVARLKEKLVETTGYPEEMLEEQLDLEADLGVDSVQRAEIWVALCKEHALDAEVRPEGPRTIANLAANLANMASSAAPAPRATTAEVEVAAPAASTREAPVWGLFAPNAGYEPDAMVPYACRKALVLLGAKKGWFTKAAERISDRGIKLVVLSADEVASMSPAEVGKLLSGCDTLVYAAHKGLAEVRPEGQALRVALKDETARLYATFKNLISALQKTPMRFIVPVSQDGTFGTTGGSKKLLGSFPAGFVRCLRYELPECPGQLIDAGDLPWEKVIEENLEVVGRWLEVGLTRHGTAVPVLSQIGSVVHDKRLLDEGDLVLVTGGARGIVFECVTALARETGCRLLLTGRTQLPEGQPDWLKTSPEDIDKVIRGLEIDLVRNEGISIGKARRQAALARTQWELVRNLERVKALGIDARYHVCDVTDAGALAKLVKKVGKSEVIAGVVHGAGVQRSQLLAELEPAQVELTIDTKLDPLFTMLDVLDWKSVKLFSGFGSITGLFGNEGQTDYAMANDLLTSMLKGLKELYPHIHCQTIEWTAWVGAGMVSEAEAKRFAEGGLIPVDIANGVAMYLDGVLGSSLPQLAAFNPTADFSSGRAIIKPRMAARPKERLTEGTRKNRAAFATLSLSRDVYLEQHRVNGEPVVPGTFVTEIFAEATRADKMMLKEVRFRRPLAVRDEKLRVEAVRDGKSVLLVPADRPDLEDKGLANLSFASCKLGKFKEGKAAKLNFDQKSLKALRKAAGEATVPFYTLLDEKFSHALATGPVFRGILATVEKGDRFYALATMTDHAVAQTETDGSFVFNPVLADMAVQVASAWSMQSHAVMAIPFEFGTIQVASRTEARDFVVICRVLESSPESSVVDVAVRDLEGNLIFSFDRMVLKSIARLDG